MMVTEKWLSRYVHCKAMVLIFIVQISFVFAQHAYNVDDFGAVGDGQTVNTQAIQQAIDHCHERGGGTVIFNVGKYVTGTIYLKSQVTLHVHAGVTLLGSTNMSDYPDERSQLPTYDQPGLTSKALIYAEGQQNIGIAGSGIIDGQGEEIDLKSGRTTYQSPSFKYRPRIIHFRSCQQVVVEGVTLKNSGSWVQTYQECEDVRIRGIRVDSRENEELDISSRDEQKTMHRNTDGLDIIDCELVWITDSYIRAGDDAICIKSFSPDKRCRNIVVSNCQVSSHASGIKIGTETAGQITDVVIQNCTVFDTWGDGIAIMSVDGATVQRINVSNIVLRNIRRSPIFIRLHTRNRTYGNYGYVNQPALKDIIIDNIQGNQLSSLGCLISGIEDYPVESIAISRLNLEFEGSGEDIPVLLDEVIDDYPKGDMFGPRLPAYGFFVRHARNVLFDNVRLRTAQPDLRPSFVVEHAERIQGSVTD